MFEKRNAMIVDWKNACISVWELTRCVLRPKMKSVSIGLFCLKEVLSEMCMYCECRIDHAGSF